MIVSDRGPGIDEEKKETLLKRLDEQTIHRHSGIGLRLVMAIVSRYKGKVRIRDRVKGDPSHGTKFIVTLLRRRE